MKIPNFDYVLKSRFGVCLVLGRNKNNGSAQILLIFESLLVFELKLTQRKFKKEMFRFRKWVFWINFTFYLAWNYSWINLENFENVFPKNFVDYSSQKTTYFRQKKFCWGHLSLKTRMNIIIMHVMQKLKKVNFILVFKIWKNYFCLTRHWNDANLL